MIAVAAHLALVALAILAPSGAPPPEDPPVRLVFVEPPPPPPPPAPGGPADGAGAMQASVAPMVPEPVVERPNKPAETAPSEPKRLRRPEPKAKPKPKAAPTPPMVEPGPSVAAASAAPGATAGSVDGAAGGIPGGMAGGIDGGTGSGPIPVSQVAYPPVLVRRIAPAYPQKARQDSIEGLVLLEAILDREGRVEPNVKVLESIPLLDAEAVAAVKRWRFRPARNHSNEPLRVILEIPIRFVLR